MPNMPDLTGDANVFGQAKKVEDTKMLDTMAHETPETVKATNTNKETVTKHPSFGTLGVKSSR